MRHLLWLAATSAALVGGPPRWHRVAPLRAFGKAIDLRPLRPLVDVVEEEYITADSKLTKDRSVVIVTTASLPWMTGTAVNPALRAAYMVGTGYEDVTLLLPWLEDDADQRTLFNGRVFANKSEQESFVREWISKNAPDADASSLKLGWYPSRYATGLGSILNLDDITSHIPSDKNDIVILEEPEHLNWHDLGVPRRCLHFNTTRVHLTSMRVVSFPILRRAGTATARAGRRASATSAASPTRIMKRTPSPTTLTRTARPKNTLT